MSATVGHMPAAPTSASSSSSGQDAASPRPKAVLCLVGGQRIVRSALHHLLQSQGLAVACSLRDEAALEETLRGQSKPPFDLILLLLTGGAFTTFHQVRETLRSVRNEVPLVVLSEQASRGQVYAALRIGARAYVDLDADPAELVRAVEMAAAGKVHLSPQAAQLLVDDITTASEPSHGPRLPNTELSHREVEIVQLLCEGLSSKEIAARLHISPKTVENHRHNIYRKCEVDSIACLMRHAIQHGLVAI